MVKSRGQHEILTYEYSELTHEIFLKNSIDTLYVTKKDGKEICTATVPSSLRTVLKKEGYKFTKKETTYFSGRKKVFNFKIDVVREKDKDKNIKSLQVHVLGGSLSEARDNAKNLAKKIWDVYKVKLVRADLLTRAECG